MSRRTSHVFFGLLTALTSLVVGMVIASRLDLAPVSFGGAVNVPAANSAPLDGPIDASTFRTVARDQTPTVVSIITESRRPGRTLAPPGPWDLLPFGAPREDTPVQGAGSGFIIDKAGFILTNNHVVLNATNIEVRLSGMDDLEPGLPAKVIGRDVLTDSALIQLTDLPSQPLPEARFGDSSQIAPGDWVVAIGNPFALSGTVTVGVVSAVGRPYQAASGRWEEMIQTDAAINRGNSGGPLLNIRGEVVGINTMIISDQTGGNIGIGFAVPINTVRDILPQLRQGKVVRGRIGVSVSRVPMTRAYADELGLANLNGAVITGVDERGPAKAAGLQLEDVIVEFNGKPVTDSSNLVSMVTRTAPGASVPVKIVRNKKPLTLNIRVEELDLEQEQQASAGRPGPGRTVPLETGFGMTLEELTPEILRQLQAPPGTTGAVVTEVEAGSPAAQGGVQRGDVVVRVNGQPVSNLDQVGALLDQVRSGQTARLIVWRRGQGQQLLFVRKR